MSTILKHYEYLMTLHECVYNALLFILGLSKVLPLISSVHFLFHFH